MSKPLISVVIPTYNMAATLKDTLASLERLDYPADRFETVIFDDGSSDGTEGLVRDFQSRVPWRLKYFRRADRSGRCGPAASRNDALDRAVGEVIAYTDADCIVDRDWLRAVEAAVSRGVKLMGGETWCDEAVIFPWKISPAGQRNITANLAYVRIPGLDEKMNEGLAGMVGQDTELVYRFIRAGLEFHHLPEMRVFHPVRRMTVRQILKRSFWRSNDVLMDRMDPQMARNSVNRLLYPLWGTGVSPATWLVTGCVTAAALAVWLGGPYVVGALAAALLAAVWFVWRGWRICVTYTPADGLVTPTLKERLYTLLTLSLYLPAFVRARVHGSIKHRHLML
jgi:glycosyltransferase involved in cell wall biosynthesis